MIIHKCSECGFESKGKDEYEAEIKFDNHKCSIDFNSMSTEELIKRIKERR
jgi:hypothetical protein